MSHLKSETALGAGPDVRRPTIWRGAAVGGGASLLINHYTHTITQEMHTGELAISHYPFLLFLTVVLLGLIVQPAFRSLDVRPLLSRNDLIVAAAVGFVGTAVPPLVIRFIGTITAPYYFATPENGWAEFAFPHLRPYLFPSNSGGEIAGFYQGLPPGAPVPWNVWVVPLAWWFGLITAMLMGLLFLAVVLRRQWVDLERLAFPHAEVTLSLVEEPQETAHLPSCVRSPLFWMGFTVVFGAMTWNVLGYFSPAIPVLQFLQGYPYIIPARGFPEVFTKFDFYVVGFSFFTPLEVLFSIWVFHLLAVVQVGVSTRMGFGPSTWDSGTNWQTAGGMVAFVLWGIWIARHHLGDVWRKAWRGAPDIDDSGELFSYRTATWGGLLCLVFVLGWLVSAGMTVKVALMFIAFYLIMSLGVAKIVAMAGLISLRWTWPPNQLVMGMLGSRLMGMGNFAVLGFTEALHTIWKGFSLSASSNAARLSDELTGDRRRVGIVMLVVGVLALLVCTTSLISMGYKIGAENFGDYRFTNSNRATYRMITAAVTEPEAIKTEEMGFFGVGMVVTWAVLLLMYRFPWWPLHPLGSTIAFSWPIRASAFSVFVTWLVKAIILRVGGIALYRRSQYLFLGFLVGYAAGVALSGVVDFLYFPGDGHGVHSPPM